MQEEKILFDEVFTDNEQVEILCGAFANLSQDGYFGTPGSIKFDERAMMAAYYGAELALRKYTEKEKIDSFLQQAGEYFTKILTEDESEKKSEDEKLYKEWRELMNEKRMEQMRSDVESLKREKAEKADEPEEKEESDYTFAKKLDSVIDDFISDFRKILKDNNLL